MDISKELEIIITEDGSSSLRRKDLGENYHSSYGAISESQHIFINSALDYYSLLNPNKEIRILEIGFGTGLNSLLSLDYSIRNNINIYYQAIEKYPLCEEITSKLNYSKLLNLEEEFNQIHNSPWEEIISIGERFQIYKKKACGEEIIYKDNYFDIIYFDAFAPQYEENLWSIPVFRSLNNSLIRKGIIITYSCKGDVKRGLKQSGFLIEKLPGPKGKREILRGLKP